MINRFLLVAVLLLWPVFVVMAGQQEEIQYWLKKMHAAAHSLNYEGIFVYGQHNQLSSMKIIHSATDKGERERLISMDDDGREVIRENNKVTCYLPDRNSVVVENKRPQGHYPPRFPMRPAELAQHYNLALAGKGKVAGFTAQKINIQPKDNLRYGYRLWIEEKSGLLLKTHLLLEDGTPMEQFMFTQVEFHEKIPEAWLVPAQDGNKLSWHKVDMDEKKNMEIASPGRQWRIKNMPPGFKHDMHRITHLPENALPVEHLVLSDGLATVSVFVERQQDSKDNIRGGSHMGAMHTYGLQSGDRHITVVGEVPFMTVKMIGESIHSVE